MKLTIRLDDITATMHRENFDRFIALCDTYDVRPLLGVVPENRDESLAIDPPMEDFWERIRALQSAGYSVAMHGCYHIYTSESGGLFPLNHLSEFAGLSGEDQEALIRTGKSILESHGIVTDLFMAPAHSYDKTTLRVLKENGFTRITDGFGKHPYVRDGITFYPISFRRSSSLAGGDGVTTLVVHPNTMTEEEFAIYEEIFRTHRILPYSDYLSMPGAPRSFPGNLKEYLMADLKRRLVQRGNRKTS
ncbi:MAG: DUF2334 domain-containing protein [Lachnospiraceae bacterium]|nr:DUF2334 domain-containing protein [Lachnospiraceae bacterium]